MEDMDAMGELGVARKFQGLEGPFGDFGQLGLWGDSLKEIHVLPYGDFVEVQMPADDGSARSPSLPAFHKFPPDLGNRKLVAKKSSGER